MKLPKIIITPNLSLQEMRFTTISDWFERKDGIFEIQLLETPDWRYQVIALLHELIELSWCRWKGITTEMCDEFDKQWEEDIKRGIHRPETETGFDKKCPYHRGHIYGRWFERISCWMLGVKWKDYDRVTDEAVDILLTKETHRH